MQSGRKTERQAETEVDRQTDGQAEAEIDRQTDKD